MNRVKSVIMTGLLVASFCRGAETIHPMQAIALQQIDQFVAELKLSDRELSQVLAICKEQKNSKEFTALLNQTRSVFDEIRKARGQASCRDILNQIEHDKSTRLIIVDVCSLYLTAYKKALNNKNNSMESCDKIYQTVIAYQLIDMIKEFGEDFIAFIERAQKE